MELLAAAAVAAGILPPVIIDVVVVQAIKYDMEIIFETTQTIIIAQKL